MQSYQTYLSPESHQALAALCDSRIQSVLSHHCEISAGSSILTVTSLSIQIGRAQFVVVENDWRDTPKDYLDYYFLSVRTSPAPLNIHFVPELTEGKSNYKLDHLSLNLGSKVQVARVDVLSVSKSGIHESVHYDAGLLITRVDGLRLAIVREESISGFLRIAHAETDIIALTAGLELRTSFVHNVT